MPESPPPPPAAAAVAVDGRWALSSAAAPPPWADGSSDDDNGVEVHSCSVTLLRLDAHAPTLLAHADASASAATTPDVSVKWTEGAAAVDLEARARLLAPTVWAYLRPWEDVLEALAAALPAPDDSQGDAPPPPPRPPPAAAADRGGSLEIDGARAQSPPGVSGGRGHVTIVESPDAATGSSALMRTSSCSSSSSSSSASSSSSSLPQPVTGGRGHGSELVMRKSSVIMRQSQITVPGTLSLLERPVADEPAAAAAAALARGDAKAAASVKLNFNVALDVLAAEIIVPDFGPDGGLLEEDDDEETDKQEEEEGEEGEDLESPRSWHMSGRSGHSVGGDGNWDSCHEPGSPEMVRHGVGRGVGGEEEEEEEEEEEGASGAARRGRARVRERDAAACFYAHIQSPSGSSRERRNPASSRSRSRAPGGHREPHRHDADEHEGSRAHAGGRLRVRKSRACLVRLDAASVAAQGGWDDEALEAHGAASLSQGQVLLEETLSGEDRHGRTHTRHAHAHAHTHSLPLLKVAGVTLEGSVGSETGSSAGAGTVAGAAAPAAAAVAALRKSGAGAGAGAGAAVHGSGPVARTGVRAAARVASVDVWCSYQILHFLHHFCWEQQAPQLQQPQLQPQQQGSLEPAAAGSTGVEFLGSVGVAKASVLVTDGRWNFNAPIMELLLADCDARFAKSLEQVSLETSVKLDANYYNIGKVVWEPVVEPWQVSGSYSAASCQGPPGAPQVRHRLEIASAQELNVNVTEALAQAVVRLKEMVQDSQQEVADVAFDGNDAVSVYGAAAGHQGGGGGGRKEGQGSAWRYAPYWLHNSTGVPCTFWLITQSLGGSGAAHHREGGGEGEGNVHAHMRARTQARGVRGGLAGEGQTVGPGQSVPLYVEERVEDLSRRRRGGGSSGSGSGSGGSKFAVPDEAGGGGSCEDAAAAATGAGGDHALMPHHMVCFQLAGMAVPSPPTSIDLVGSRIYTASLFGSGSGSSGSSRGLAGLVAPAGGAGVGAGPGPGGEEAYEAQVICEVSMEQYSKRVTLKSVVSLINNSAVPLEIRFDIPSTASPSSPKVLEPVLAGQSVALPLHFSATGSMQWRPCGGAYLWSERLHLPAVSGRGPDAPPAPPGGSGGKQQQQHYQQHLTLTCPPALPQSAPFHMCVSMARTPVPALQDLRDGDDSNAPTLASWTGVGGGAQSPKQQGGRQVAGGSRHGDKATWHITIGAPLVVENLLPVPTRAAIQRKIDKQSATTAAAAPLEYFIPEGGYVDVHEVDTCDDLLFTFEPQGYSEGGPVALPGAPLVGGRPPASAPAPAPLPARRDVEHIDVSPKASTGAGVRLEVDRGVTHASGARRVGVSCPFWLYNTTAFHLLVRPADSTSFSSSKHTYLAPLPPSLRPGSPVTEDLRGLDESYRRHHEEGGLRGVLVPDAGVFQRASSFRQLAGIASPPSSEGGRPGAQPQEQQQQQQGRSLGASRSHGRTGGGGGADKRSRVSPSKRTPGGSSGSPRWLTYTASDSDLEALGGRRERQGAESAGGKAPAGGAGGDLRPGEGHLHHQHHHHHHHHHHQHHHEHTTAGGTQQRAGKRLTNSWSVPMLHLDGGAASGAGGSHQQSTGSGGVGGPPLPRSGSRRSRGSSSWEHLPGLGLHPHPHEEAAAAAEPCLFSQAELLPSSGLDSSEARVRIQIVTSDPAAAAAATATAAVAAGQQPQQQKEQEQGGRYRAAGGPGSSDRAVSSSAWSDAFPLEPPGGVAVLTIPWPNSRRLFVLAVSAARTEGASESLSKTLTVRPRYVLASALREEICYKQQGTDAFDTLPPGHHMAVHWADRERNFLICVRLNEHGWDWSGGFAPDHLGDTQVKLRNHVTGAMRIVRVDVSTPQPGQAGAGLGDSGRGCGTCLLLLSDDTTGFVPYRIDNFSKEMIRFHQQYCESSEESLRPYSTCDYAWDEPCLPHRLVISVPGAGGSIGTFRLDEVKNFAPVVLAATALRPERRLQVAVRPEGPKRVLSVIDVDMHSWESTESAASEAARGGGDHALGAAASTPATLAGVEVELALKLAYVGVSLVDSTPQELLYLSARGVHVQAVQGQLQQLVEAQVASVQVDNQLRQAMYPVLLCSSANKPSSHSPSAPPSPAAPPAPTPAPPPSPAPTPAPARAPPSAPAPAPAPSAAAAAAAASSMQLALVADKSQGRTDGGKGPGGGHVAGAARSAGGAGGKQEETAPAPPAAAAETEADVALVVRKWRHPVGSVDCYQLLSLRVAPLRVELEELCVLRCQQFVESLWASATSASSAAPPAASSSSTSASSALLDSHRSASEMHSHSIATSSFGSLDHLARLASHPSPPRGGASGAHAGPGGSERRQLGQALLRRVRCWPSPAALVAVAGPDLDVWVLARSSTKVYIERVLVESIHLSISFASAPWLPEESRGAAARGLLGPVGIALQRRMMALADVEGARVTLAALSLAHPLGSVGAIKGRVARHYTRQVLHVVYKILGSVDFLGNPVSFLQSLGSGVWDFVSAPASTILQSPREFSQGVAKGTASLVSNTVFAVTNAATRMSGAAAKGVASVALDQEYLAELQRRQQELGEQDSGVVAALLEGITGVLEYPIHGLYSGGVPGLLSGVLKGIVGAVAKPTASALELAGRTAQAIRNSTRPHALVIVRVRPPRHVSRDVPLRAYSWEEAVGHAVLLEAGGGRLKDEVYVACAPLKLPGRFALLTGRCLLQVRSSTLARSAGERLAPGTPQWTIEAAALLENILLVEVEGSTLRVLEMQQTSLQNTFWGQRLASSEAKAGGGGGGGGGGGAGRGGWGASSSLDSKALEFAEGSQAASFQSCVSRTMALAEERRKAVRRVVRSRSATQVSSL